MSNVDISNLAKVWLGIVEDERGIGFTKEDMENARAVAILFKTKADEPPLLTIELKDEDSVPVVRYQGDAVQPISRVSFEWETSTNEPSDGGTSYNIDYFDTDHKRAVKKGLGLSTGKFMFDEQKEVTKHRCPECGRDDVKSELLYRDKIPSSRLIQCKACGINSSVPLENV